MALRGIFLVGLAAAAAAYRIGRRTRSLAPRRPLESDPILSVEEYKAVDLRKSESGTFAHKLVVKFIDEAHLRANGSQVASSAADQACAMEVSFAAASLGVKLRPVFQDIGEELEDLARRAEERSGVQQPDMRSVVSVDLAVQDAEHLVAAAKHFDASRCVEYISIRGTENPPPPNKGIPTANVICHTELPANGSIPDFTAAQGYARPGQLDADYLHSLGADGSGIMYADAEYSMNFDHVEFSASRITEAPGFPARPDFYEYHGTAVVGVTLGSDGFGIKGLANKADGYFFSEYPVGAIGSEREQAVAAAISKVRPGDIVLLEMQAGDPMGPEEVTQTSWVMTKMGSDAGVVIVATAGNGAANLDSAQFAAYRARGDSGAIMVGAGTPAHARVSFSTYGSRLDVQAWGDWTVMTSGYGACTGFPGHNVLGSDYTNAFAGTSSAGAVVAGALTLFQSWALRELGAPLWPHRLRDILRTTGYPQTDSSGHIGPHINLRELVEVARVPTPAPPTPAPTPWPTPICEDQYPECPQWAEHCSLDHMKEICCVTCTNGAPAPTPPPSGCRDLNQYCGDWAAAGECQNNPQYMAVNCRASCGFCQ